MKKIAMFTYLRKKHNSYWICSQKDFWHKIEPANWPSDTQSRHKLPTAYQEHLKNITKHWNFKNITKHCNYGKKYISNFILNIFFSKNLEYLISDWDSPVQFNLMNSRYFVQEFDQFWPTDLSGCFSNFHDVFP